MTLGLVAGGVAGRCLATGPHGALLAAYRFEGRNLKWKGGRSGHGKMPLLADQDLLLVLSEDANSH